jgi:hypothetical protein
MLRTREACKGVRGTEMSEVCNGFLAAAGLFQPKTHALRTAVSSNFAISESRGWQTGVIDQERYQFSSGLTGAQSPGTLRHEHFHLEPGCTQGREMALILQRKRQE